MFKHSANRLRLHLHKVLAVAAADHDVRQLVIRRGALRAGSCSQRNSMALGLQMVRGIGNQHGALHACNPRVMVLRNWDTIKVDYSFKSTLGCRTQQNSMQTSNRGFDWHR